jgi:hypothetical protein
LRKLLFGTMNVLLKCYFIACQVVPLIDLGQALRAEARSSWSVVAPFAECRRKLRKRGINFRCLTKNIDTTTIQGEFLFNIFSRWPGRRTLIDTLQRVSSAENLVS